MLLIYARILTVPQIAVANGLDPYRYLLHVFETMPTLKTSDELQQLLPWNVVLDQPLSASRLYDILKGFFAEVADTLPPSQHEMAARIRNASTHWLRHTFATHFLQSGGELAILRDLLGHQSLATTSVYVTTERDNRSRAMEKFGKTAVL